ncbi:MAG: NAD(P)H-quinone oxidoreductase [Acidobacteriia bacterium]|nr:NAD(P)H-quinone oxidoreductase [Methyloceanibacter sp.]MCL6490761.1 NAD(P)H-quinone oxidoreductase [Terriglobia bacterium]
MTEIQSMRHVAVEQPGGPEVLRVVSGPVPTPGAGEVLIHVLAAGVNRPDVLQRQGRYPPPPGASPILGLEVAGEIVKLGAGVERWKVGDRVTALANGGGYAEFCAVPAAQCLPWPRGFDAIQSAALPETFFTVWANLFELGELKAGETALVHGGSSGIGTTAIQLGRAFGAGIYVTAGTEEKCEACVRLGAVAAINYRTQDFAQEIKRLTEGAGVDVVLDMVGGPYAERNIRCLKAKGRLVLIAFLGGSTVEHFDLLPVMTRRLKITGSTMRPRTTAEKGAIAAALQEHVWPLLEAGKCAPVIHAVFPLAEAAAAHRLMESGAHIGKIVLRVAD